MSSSGCARNPTAIWSHLGAPPCPFQLNRTRRTFHCRGSAFRVSGSRWPPVSPRNDDRRRARARPLAVFNGCDLIGQTADLGKTDARAAPFDQKMKYRKWIVYRVPPYLRVSTMISIVRTLTCATARRWIRALFQVPPSRSRRRARRNRVPTSGLRGRRPEALW